MSAPVPSRPSEVKDWCISNGFHPSKTLGQNFLVDGNTVEAILDAAGVAEGTRVLEVGPGFGALTRAMAERGASVTAVEKDARLAELLEGSTPSTPNPVHVLAADMLELSLDELLAPGFDAFVSNLPYSVGTRILLDVCRHPLAPPLCVVMVQREVAERLAAAPGEPARGQAGVWVQDDFRVTPLRTVRPTCFWPRPEVSSTVVRLDAVGGPREPDAARRAFERLTKLAFMHRRKQLGTVLRKGGARELGLAGENDVARLFEEAAVAASARAEELSRDDWRRLARRLAALKEGG